MTELYWPVPAPVALGNRLAELQAERNAAFAVVDLLAHEHDEGPYSSECRVCRLAEDNAVHRTRRRILSELAHQAEAER